MAPNGTKELGFEDASTAFVAWFSSVPHAELHPHLDVVDYRQRDAGRGLSATADIPANTALFTIPRDAIITTENSSLVKAHPDFFTSLTESTNDEDAELDPWAKLILTLVYEFLHEDRSPWKPYLDVLPTETDFNTLMFWDDTELAELKGSAVLSKIGKSSAEELFRGKLLPLIRANSELFFSSSIHTAPSDDELVTLMHKVGSTIMAYAFDLENEDDAEEEDGWIEDREGQVLGMVPMADMLNADAEFNAHLNHGETSLTMTSLRLIKAGEEVLNYYGPLPNSDLLRRYGYVSDKHRLHDVAEVAWDTVVAAAAEVLAIDNTTINAMVSKMDEDDLADSFVFEFDVVEPDSTGKLMMFPPEAIDIPEDLRAQLKALLKIIKKSDAQLQIDSTTLWKILARVIETQLAAYPTSLTEDTQLVPSATGRKLQAIKVRMGEKRILQLAARTIEENLAALRDETAQQTEPSAKRRKIAA